MKNKALVVLSIFIIGALVYFLTADAPEERVKKRIEEFRVAAMQPIGKEGLHRISMVKGLEKYFTEDMVITAGGGKFVLKGRAELSRIAQIGYARATPVDVSLSDVTVELQSDDLALVYLTVLVKGGDFGERWKQAQELKLSLKYFDGDWRFATAETVEALTLEE